MTLALKNSLSIVLTGWLQSGKTEQAKRVFDARRADNSYPFRPMLVISCETSTSGTMGRVISHKDCTYVAIDNLAEYTAAVTTILDAGHGAQFDQDGDITVQGHPFRSVFFDGWTAFTEGSKADAQTLATEDDGKKTLDPKAKQNDARIPAKVGAAEARVALRQWSGAGAKHQGLLMISTAHAAEKWIPKPNAAKGSGERIQVGERLDLAPLPMRWLMNGANCCLLLKRQLVDVDSLDQLDAVEPEDVAPTYYALTRPVTIAGYEYDNVKWQDGIFRPTKRDAEGKIIAQPHDVRVKWNNPDLGAALLESPLLIAPPKPTASPSPKVPPAAA